MARKLKTKNGRAVYARRKVIVEPVFGQMHTRQNAKQLLLRGLEQAKEPPFRERSLIVRVWPPGRFAQSEERATVSTYPRPTAERQPFLGDSSGGPVSRGRR